MSSLSQHSTATRFQVKRSSMWSEETAPCSEAVKGTTAVWDVRTFKSPEEHDAKLGPREKWYERGTEHQIVRGPRGGAIGIKRRVEDRTAWFVAFDSLEALLAFSDKHGEVILGWSREDPDLRSIEIYDDWRE